MKKYRYKFSVLMYIVIGLAIALSAVTITLNVKNLITIDVNDKYATYVVSIFIGLLIIAFAITALCIANYKITKDGITTQISLIKSTISFDNVKTITHLKLSNKLAVQFEDNSYITLNVSPKVFDEIASLIKDYKNTVEYQISEEY